MGEKVLGNAGVRAFWAADTISTKAGVGGRCGGKGLGWSEVWWQWNMPMCSEGWSGQG